MKAKTLAGIAGFAVIMTGAHNLIEHLKENPNLFKRQTQTYSPAQLEARCVALGEDTFDDVIGVKDFCSGLAKDLPKTQTQRPASYFPTIGEELDACAEIMYDHGVKGDLYPPCKDVASRLGDMYIQRLDTDGYLK